MISGGRSLRRQGVYRGEMGGLYREQIWEICINPSRKHSTIGPIPGM